MNPKDFQPGDLLDPNDGRYLHFIESVDRDGVWMELVVPPRPYERMGEIVTMYSKNAGHGCFVPFKPCSWWPGWDRHKWHGRVPSLIGQRSISITAPM